MDPDPDIDEVEQPEQVVIPQQRPHRKHRPPSYVCTFMIMTQLKNSYMWNRPCCKKEQSYNTVVRYFEFSDIWLHKWFQKWFYAKLFTSTHILKVALHLSIKRRKGCNIRKLVLSFHLMWQHHLTCLHSLTGNTLLLTQYLDFSRINKSVMSVLLS